MHRHARASVSAFDTSPHSRYASERFDSKTARKASGLHDKASVKATTASKGRLEDKAALPLAFKDSARDPSIIGVGDDIGKEKMRMRVHWKKERRKERGGGEE
jgi:hypothetical protein